MQLAESWKRRDRWADGRFVGRDASWAEGKLVGRTAGKPGSRKGIVGRKLEEKGHVAERAVGRTVGRADGRERTLERDSRTEGQLGGRTV